MHAARGAAAEAEAAAEAVSSDRHAFVLPCLCTFKCLGMRYSITDAMDVKLRLHAPELSCSPCVGFSVCKFTHAMQSTAASANIGRGAPEGAWAPVLRVHIATADLPHALASFKRFLVLGGRPGRRVLNRLVAFCLKQGEPAAASRVVRAAVSFYFYVTVLGHSECCKSSDQSFETGNAAEACERFCITSPWY